MAAITSSVIAAAGVGLSVAQAVKQNKLAKQAQQASKVAAQKAGAITEQNPWAGVQAPTLGSNMARNEINQQAADSLDALKSTGAAGVIAGATDLNKSVRDANLDIAANQDDALFRRNALQAQAQSGINQRKAERDFGLGISELEGAQSAGADAAYNRSRAIEGAFAGLSGIADNVGDMEQFDYMKKKNKV